MNKVSTTAVFIADYTIGNSPSILNLLDLLASRGTVDVYLNNAALKKCDIWQNPNIRLVDFGPNPLPGSAQAKLQQGYDHYIAIDPHGFVFCLELFPQSQPVYYSLELYLKEDHDGLDYSPQIMQAERSRINRIKGLIIQSEEKEHLFRQDYALESSIPSFILPVTYKGPSDSEKSQFLRQKYNIGPDKKIALHLGGIAKWHSCSQLACIFSKLKDWVLFFHGYPAPQYANAIKQVMSRHDIQNVIISDNTCDNLDGITEVVKSCDVGIAWYNDISTGFRVAGKSSGKIPAYMRFGLPVIAKKYPSTIEAIEQTGAGLCVDEHIQIVDALAAINANYEHYSQNALAEYDKTYRFENYEAGLLGLLETKSHSVPHNKIRPSTPARTDSLSILETVEFYHPHVGGAELVIQEIAERLVKRGHRVTVATTADPNRTFTQLNGVDIAEFKVTGNLASGYGGMYGIQGPDIKKYRRFLLTHPADVMMNYAVQQWATDLAFEILPHIRHKRVNILAPCGYSALSDRKTVRWPIFTDYFKRIIPAFVPLYDAVVYHSSQYQDYEFGQDHGFRNSVVIHNGVDEEEFAAKPAINFREKYGVTTKYMGLSVGNFYGTRKRQDRIIEAVRQMNRPDFTMVFVGKEGPPLADYRKLAQGMKVQFLTDISRPDTVAAYHSADLFFLGSDNEASPLVIIEAKASRTPFISTDCGNVREWQGGIVCSPEKMAFYANGILDDEKIHASLAESGYREWKEKLTWESVVDRYEQLYLDLHAKKKAPVPVNVFANA